MATYFVASGGSNTSPYDTWAKAATSLATALAAATTDGDIVVIQYNAVPSTDAELAADTSYIPAAEILIVSASNDGGSSWTPTEMGTANWIGNSTTNRTISLSGSDREYQIWGVTFRTAGATTDSINIGSTSGTAPFLENCYLWSGNTSTSSVIALTVDGRAYAHLRNCTFRFGATAQSLAIGSTAILENCTISSDGSTPSVLFSSPGPTPTNVKCVGCDFSLVTGTLVGNIAGPVVVEFERCVFGSGVTVLATQSLNPTKASAKAWVFDCSSGDTHGLFGYYDALGSCISDTGIYFTAGAAAQSWKIVTTANAHFQTPFFAPWIDLYNTGTSAITPYFEILRDGSSTAYQNDEVWAEFSAKVTSASTKASFYNDRKTLTATAENQAAGAGLSSWTGENATSWSGKCDSGSSLTPAENGYVRGRLVVGEPSITVYLDPQIRT